MDWSQILKKHLSGITVAEQLLKVRPPLVHHLLRNFLSQIILTVFKINDAKYPIPDDRLISGGY